MVDIVEIPHNENFLNNNKLQALHHLMLWFTWAGEKHIYELTEASEIMSPSPFLKKAIGCIDGYWHVRYLEIYIYIQHIYITDSAQAKLFL